NVCVQLCAYLCVTLYSCDPHLLFCECLWLPWCQCCKQQAGDRDRVSPPPLPQYVCVGAWLCGTACLTECSGCVCVCVWGCVAGCVWVCVCACVCVCVGMDLCVCV